MYGEDGTQRVVYKLKEEHAREGSKQKRKKERTETKKKKKKKCEKRKRIVSITKENDRCTSSGPSVYLRVNLFIIQKLT